ncbi:Hypothetical protein PHPALM_20922 [Phytophthora palmivora]|uniref:Tyrosinase copper-binding domain-containing protein n=1 Tax=Phytophthora palmivora TaxID=4796 RepID=A0A2P4XDM4_9STRA|nr:Hypothetical protein PHPALM_20922 [Phytophthora palmivora]
MDKGFHQKFIQIHTEYISETQAHGNCICVPFISDSSGDMTGVNKGLLIYNVTIPYSSGTTACITQGVLSRFCGNSTTCAKCITRKTKSAMASTAYPSSASFGSVYQQLFSSNDSYTFTTQVERNVHNTIHSSLDGVMGYFQSPADPIFYLHHALIDLLQVIYLKCQVGGENILLSSTDKGSDLRWYSNCLKRFPKKAPYEYYSASDTVAIRGLAFDGKTLVNVWENPNNTLYPFFKDLPSKYADYVDAKDLGNYSYSYAISGGLATLYQNCWKATTMSAANSTVTALMADESEIKYPRDGKQQLDPVIESGTTYDEKVKRWNIALYEAARVVGYEEAAAREQMEMVVCQYQDDCLGGVQDYTPLFRANFNVEGHPRCYTLVEYLKSGDRVIGIPQWKEITNRFLPCAAYKRKVPVSGFEKAISDLKKGFESGKSLDDYVSNKLFASA